MLQHRINESLSGESKNYWMYSLSEETVYLLSDLSSQLEMKNRLNTTLRQIKETNLTTDLFGVTGLHGKIRAAIQSQWKCTIMVLLSVRVCF